VDVHSIIPNELEWLIVLTCINPSGQYIPNFYIFKGMHMRHNYIRRCKTGATMAMSRKAWMIGFLFSAWIDHFIQSLQCSGGISPENPHLLILNGHNSHITIEVVAKAKEVGLHLVNLPSHTSHALQPLDVSVFGPFKHAFQIYRDIWAMNNKGRGAKKVVLAEWVSIVLGRALTAENIQSGFCATGIYPLNSHALDSKMGPSTVYKVAGADIDALSQEVQTLTVEEVMEEGECKKHLHCNVTLRNAD
jgi:hypothetical protein